MARTECKHFYIHGEGVTRWPLTARVRRASLYRARSASKNGCLTSSVIFSYSVLEGQPGVFPMCARPTRAFRDRALREHRESPGPFLFPESLYPEIKGVAKVALYCAHRTSTFLSCAFCEQEGHLGTPFSSFQARPFSLQGWGLIDLPLRASNEGSPRPRVARAQKIIRLHPFLS